jgi:hypothetical protein
MDLLCYFFVRHLVGHLYIIGLIYLGHTNVLCKGKKRSICIFIHFIGKESVIKLDVVNISQSAMRCEHG